MYYFRKSKLFELPSSMHTAATQGINTIFTDK